MKQPFIGARLEDIQLSSFAKHGIPVPAYSLSGGLLLLFNNQLECKKYVDLLEAIGWEMQILDPQKINEPMQLAIIFINQLIDILNCD